jgi:hypothetical protein
MSTNPVVWWELASYDAKKTVALLSKLPLKLYRARKFVYLMSHLALRLP